MGRFFWVSSVVVAGSIVFGLNSMADTRSHHRKSTSRRRALLPKAGDRVARRSGNRHDRVRAGHGRLRLVRASARDVQYPDRPRHHRGVALGLQRKGPPDGQADGGRSRERLSPPCSGRYQGFFGARLNRRLSHGICVKFRRRQRPSRPRTAWDRCSRPLPGQILPAPLSYRC